MNFHARRLNDLFDDQAEALQRLREVTRSGKKRPVLSIPTGGGKTVIACHVIHGALAKGNRVAFTVPMLSIVDQTFDRFVENGIDPAELDVIQGQHAWHRPQAPVKIVSVMTLPKRERPDVDIVVVDECHMGYEVIRKWMKDEPNKLFIGLSATPWRAGMAEEYDSLVQTTSVRKLIDAGRLCKFRTFAPTDVDLKGVKTVAGDFEQGELGRRMRNARIVADVVQTWLDRAERRPTLCYAVDRAHAAQLHTQFGSMGVRTAYIDGETPREERKPVITMLEEGSIAVIISVATMTTGVDIPCVSCISDAAPTKSEIRHMQKIGRGLRVFPDKDYLLILDHGGSAMRLGTADCIGHEELLSGKIAARGPRKQAEKVVSPRECVKCKCLIPPTEHECPQCGWVPKAAPKVNVIEGELYEIGVTKAQKNANETWSVQDKAKFFGQLKLYAMQHDYKPGWAWQKYRTKFGVWPSYYAEVRDALIPEYISDATLSWIRSQNIRWRYGATNREQPQRGLEREADHILVRAK